MALPKEPPKKGIPKPQGGGIPKPANKNAQKQSLPKQPARAAKEQAPATKSAEEAYKERIARLEAELAKAQENTTDEPVSSPESAQDEQDNAENSEWAVHEKTGVKYKKIPKAQYDSEGNPLATVTDEIDFDNFNDSAKQFLGHLQVSPSKREREEFLKKRRQRQAKSSEEFEKNWEDFDWDNASVY